MKRCGVLVIVEVTLIVTLTLALHRELSPQLHTHARRVIEDARKHYLQLLDANNELKKQLTYKDFEHSKLHSFHGRDEKAHSVSLISRAIVGSVDALNTLGFTLEELQESGVYDLIQQEFQDLNLCKKYDYVCETESPYRTPDGSCNNLDNPTWGTRFEPQSRILPAAYDNDVEGKLDCCKDRTRKECFPVLIPKGDPHFPDGTCFNFIRSAGSTGSCRPGIKQQQNQVTSYIDLSTVYGPSAEREESLRDECYMLMDGGGNILPPPRENTCHLTHIVEHCFLAGDARVHENPSLGSYHTLFVQRHNTIAKKLENLHFNWTKERIFQEAKKINVAAYQHVVYNEFLPALMPARALKQYNLKIKTFGYSTSYNSTLDVTTTNELGIAFR